MLSCKVNNNLLFLNFCAIQIKNRNDLIGVHLLSIVYFVGLHPQKSRNRTVSAFQLLYNLRLILIPSSQ